MLPIQCKVLTSHFLLKTAISSSVILPCFAMSAGLIFESKLFRKLSAHNLKVLA